MFFTVCAYLHVNVRCPSRSSWLSPSTGPSARATSHAVTTDAPRTNRGSNATTRPWHVVAQIGAAHLGDAELLALLMGAPRGGAGHPVAEALLTKSDGLVGLASAVRDGPSRCMGMRPRQAAMLASAFELVHRIGRARRAQRPFVLTAADAYALVGAEMSALSHEELWILPLDPHCRLIQGHRIVSKGDVDGTDAGPRLFFRHALLAGATSAIAIHCHPSGDPTPSAADRAVTQRWVAAGRSIDVQLVDHVIIASGRYVSLRAAEPGLFR